MAPWESIEFGFRLGVHVMFALMGATTAIALIVGAIWDLWAVTEALKPNGEK